MANRVCERCIHYDVCLLHEDNFIDDVAKNGFCGKFKNKSDFVKAVYCKDCAYKDECCQEIHFRNSGYDEIEYCSYGERSDT